MEPEWSRSGAGVEPESSRSRAGVEPESTPAPLRPDPRRDPAPESIGVREMSTATERYRQPDAERVPSRESHRPDFRADNPSMPTPRIVLPGVTAHVRQRGVDRGPTFIADEDFAFYRLALGVAACKTQCRVHAYALMTNHVHLLVTPSDAEGLARMMMMRLCEPCPVLFQVLVEILRLVQ